MARDRNAEPRFKNSPDTVIPTFKVKHLETGDVLEVDVRTFDPDVHERIDAPPAKKGKKEK